MALSPVGRRGAGETTAWSAASVTRGWRERRTSRGVRLVQHGVLLSELCAQRGPTHTLFDVLAAAMSVALTAAPHRAPNAAPRALVLGFAGGSLVGPLRALGVEEPLEAVDLSLAGVAAFRRVCGAYAGDVRVHRAEACAFLSAARRRYQVIVDDLSVPVDGDLIKPAVSYDTLPRAIARRLAPRGLAIVNLLPTPGHAWAAARHAVRRPFPSALEVRFRDYANRLVLAGHAERSARSTGLGLRSALRAIASRQAERITLHAR